MSFLAKLFGRSAPPPPPPPPPPPSDTLVLTGAGLDGATGPVEVTFAVGDRTFTATATRRGAGTAFPAEFALSEIREVVPEPEPAPAPPPPPPPPPAPEPEPDPSRSSSPSPSPSSPPPSRRPTAARSPSCAAR